MSGRQHLAVVLMNLCAWFDSQFCVALFQVAKKSADLRQYVKAWDREMAAVNTYVDLSKNLPDKSSSSSFSSSDDESVDGDTDKAVLCKSCNPTEKTG